MPAPDALPFEWPLGASADGTFRVWAPRAEAWGAGTGLISEHPWLGVGPANFSRHFPSSSSFIAWQPSRGPQSFVLEAVTAAGWGALIALGAALILFFWRCARSRASAPPSRPEEERGLGWEFTLGGMLGLLLAFALRARGGSDTRTGATGAGRRDLHDLRARC